MKILQKEKIKFQKEYSFKGLKKGKYRFDFFCPDVGINGSLIEVQGEQHYKFIKKFYEKKTDFLAAQERDRIKISYCLSRQINLYCIPYWEIDNLNTIKDVFNPKFLAKTKWKNDLDWRAFNN